MSADPERVAAVRAAFVRDRGFWGDTWETIAGLDAEFLDAYREMSGLVWRRDTLDTATKELICVAVDAVTTHLYEPGIEQHIRQALAAGATPAEVMETLELVTSVGLHGPAVAAQALAEHVSSVSPAGLREQVIAERGYWDPEWDALAGLDPELLAAHLAPGSVPWRTGPLPRKVKHLILLAANATVTGLHGPAIRLHVAEALRHGAAPAEILDTLGIAGMVGIHAMTTAAPMLARAAHP